MKIYTPAELAVILDAHKRWLMGDKDGSRADLSRADLSWANLSWADLSWANLSRANLSRANLSRANLSRADLSWADLSWADLSRANLSWANLSRANLSGADLSRANLSGANLSGADLSGANLSRADLPPTSIVPETGSFTAYKKLAGGVIATLEIPADAERVGGLAGRKCRASKAKVMALSAGDVGYSAHRRSFAYRVGETVTPDAYDPDIRVECAQGIHFFITRKEAKDYDD